MSFLLQARFNNSGPTNTDIVNLGSVDFSHTSRIRNGNRSAFFEPCDDRTGLEITGSTKQNCTNYIGEDGNRYCIYFKFKIDLRHRISREPLPILSYIDPVTDEPTNWLNIEENDHFCYYVNNNEWGSSTDCKWVFDDNWHTFLLNRDYNSFDIYIDGILLCHVSLIGTVHIKHTAHMYIGRKARTKNSTDHYLTLQSGQLDDICIVDDIVYRENFIPPNMYWKGTNSSSNYYFYTNSSISDIPKDLAQVTEKKLLQTAFHINETQKGWLPRRLRIQWHEEDYVWDRENYHTISLSREYTALFIFGLDQPLLMEPYNARFVDIFNAQNGVDDGILYPFMMFVDKKFVKLSDIFIMKSDQYYTVFIDKRLPDKYNLIKSVEIVLIPFKCIYEEDEPLRTDIPALYVFNEDGYFDPVKPYSAYYIDKEKSPDIEFTGILEQVIDPDELAYAGKDKDSGKFLTDQRILNSQWRHGYFTVSSIISSHEVNLKFNSSENDFKATVGSEFSFYRNKISMNEYDYEIIGTDLFKFRFKEGYTHQELLNKIITMQLIVDKTTTKVYPSSGGVMEIANGIANMKFVVVRAEEVHQNKLKIPDVLDDNGYPYNNILVFRNSVCMNGKGRFRISDAKYIIFTESEGTEIINKPDPFTFVYVHTDRCDQFGPMHVTPIHLSTYTGAEGATINSDGFTTNQIFIPVYKDLEYTKDNVFFFVNGTLIDPNRYTIKSKTVSGKTRYYVDMDTSLANTYYKTTTTDGSGFELNKEVMFVILRVSSSIEDPSNPGEEEIKGIYQQGGRFVLYDLNIDKHIKITLDNFILFDMEGKYMPEITGEVFNYNIIKMIISTNNPRLYIPRYLTCVYSRKRSLPNAANTILPTNDQLMKNYIRLRHEFYELDEDFQQFMHDYEFMYSRDTHYTSNLSRAVFYTLQHNQWHFLNLYKKRSSIQRMKVDIGRFNQRIDEDGYLAPIVPFDGCRYKDPAHRSFVMYFLNGTIPTWYNSIKYKGNKYTFRIPNKLNKTDTLEVIKFHNMYNQNQLVSDTIT